MSCVTGTIESQETHLSDTRVLMTFFENVLLCGSHGNTAYNRLYNSVLEKIHHHELYFILHSYNAIMFYYCSMIMNTIIHSL